MSILGYPKMNYGYPKMNYGYPNELWISIGNTLMGVVQIKYHDIT